MKKIETIWHHLLWLALEKKQYRHTQQSLALHFGYSLSTVNLAIKQVAATGAIEVLGKFFVVRDVKKMLLYWATHRSLEKSIIYQTFVDEAISQIEGLISPEIIFAGFSAASRILGEAPADYSKVYIYADESQIDEIQKRFPKSPKPANLIVLKSYSKQKEYGQITTIPQTFVDLWNMSDWYAKDFTYELERKIDGLLS